MAKDLFLAWTWRMPLPEPFFGLESVSQIHHSKYNTGTVKSSHLHAPCLKAILAYLDLDTTWASASGNAPGAIGMQGNEMCVAEYGETDPALLFFNKVDGKFIATHADSGSHYLFDENHEDGAALIFTLLPLLEKDEEFELAYTKLAAAKESGWANMEAALEAAFVLCDNIAQRTTKATDNSIVLDLPNDGAVKSMATTDITAGVYKPTSALYGSFKYLNRGTAASGQEEIKTIEPYIGVYQYSTVPLSSKDAARIPRLPKQYEFCPEALRTADLVLRTTGTPLPFRQFMYLGDSGTGKTVAAQLVCMASQRPYFVTNCDNNTNAYTFKGNYTPNVKTKKDKHFLTRYRELIPSQDTTKRMPLQGLMELATQLGLPTPMDISLNPASAYRAMTGFSSPEVTEANVNDLLEIRIREHYNNLVGDTSDFKFDETEFAKAIQRPSVLELMEFLTIKSPAIAVGLNSVMDINVGSMVLSTGEIIHRHPDSIIIATSNMERYRAVKKTDQSVISRFNMVFMFKEPTLDSFIRRAMVSTGCENEAMVRKLATVMQSIQRHCEHKGYFDGVAGQRELNAWCQYANILGDELGGCRETVVNKVSFDPAIQDEVYRVCVLPFFPAAT